MSVFALDTIKLNGHEYKIKGTVVGSFADMFPDQQSIGDPSYSNRRELSSYIISDLRGGIIVEEMDETLDWNRSWWTNCITQFRGHILPPRLATAITAPTQPATITPTLTNADFETSSSGWTGGARDSGQAHGGTYSYIVSTGATIYQDAATWDNSWRS